MVNLEAIVPPKKLKHIICNKGESCPHRSTCWYSHSVQEKKDNTIKKPCIYMNADRTCPKLNCKFDHSFDLSLIVKSNKPCHFMQENGTCKFGLACKYSHNAPSAIQQPFEPFLIDLDDSEETFDLEEYKKFYVIIHKTHVSTMYDFINTLPEAECTPIL